MPYHRAECLIFTTNYKEEPRAKRRKSNTPDANDRVRGYVLLPAAFLNQHPKVARLLEQNCLRAVRNEDVPRLPARDHRLSAYEIFLDENPSASVDPISISTDHSDASFLPLLIYCTTVKVARYTCKAREMRPAVDETNREVYKHLASRNFDLGEGDSGGILHLATSRRQEVLMGTALDNGAEINSKTDRGSSALHLAVRGGSIPLVKVLLDRGANVDTKDRSHRTPLHDACWKDLKLAQVLLDKGADVNANTASSGTRGTPLHEASKSGKPDIVLMLLKRGAVVDVRNYLQETPLHLAQKSEVQEILLQNGADANSYDKYAWTPIEYAIQSGRADTVEILLDYGARVDAIGLRNISERVMRGPQPFDTAKLLLEYCFTHPKLLTAHLQGYFSRVRGYAYQSERKVQIDQLIVEHAVKVMALHNLPTLEGVDVKSEWKNNIVNVAEFRQKCNSEVASLKNQKFSGTDVSLRDMLGMDEYRVYRLLKNPAVSRAIDPDNLKKRFPLYGDILNLHIGKGKHRRWLQREGIKSFKVLTPSFQKLPDDIKEGIIGLLSTIDIMKLRRAKAARSVKFGA